MSVYSPVYHAMVFSPAAPKPGPRPVQADSVFHHLLEVVNPLQHLPLIGTLYRAVSGDQIGPVEKIAGDTLYGGLWGAVSSIADVAFEGLTGKSVEETVLAWFKTDSAVPTASLAAPTIVAAQSLPCADLPALPPENQAGTGLAQAPAGVGALRAALAAKGVDSAIASRALYAYGRALGTPVFASVN